VTGSVLIDLAGFVQVYGSFAFSKQTGVDVTSVVTEGLGAGTATVRTVNVVTFGLDGVDVFVGSGPYFMDGNDNGIIDDSEEGRPSATTPSDCSSRMSRSRWPCSSLRRVWAATTR
jgi:hypothetical protein